jgi:keratin-associated matrix protein
LPLDATIPRAEAWQPGLGWGLTTGVGAGVGCGVGLGVGFGVGLGVGFGVAVGPFPPLPALAFVPGFPTTAGRGVARVGVGAGTSDGTADGSGSTDALGDGLADGSGAVGVGCEPGSVEDCGPGPPGRDEGCAVVGDVGFADADGPPGPAPVGAVGVGSVTAMPGVANGAPVMPMPSATDANTRLITPRASTSRRRCAAVTSNPGSSDGSGWTRPAPVRDGSTGVLEAAPPGPQAMVRSGPVGSASPPV